MTEIYVSPTGSDSAAGTAAAPLRTIPRAIGVARPGDTIAVTPGTYTSGTIWMRPGAEGREIRLVSTTPRAAKLRSTDFAVIRMANYTAVEGFDLSGPQHGIFSEDVHHITMRGNYAHDLGNTGIGAQRSDFITIEGNECARCAADTWDSGISIYEPKVWTGDTTTKLRIIIRGNVCRDNVTGPAGGPHTDGNGIILDDFNWTQRSGARYPYGALVENNLCTGNGGKGIQVAWSDDCVIRRNTVVGNNRDRANWGSDPLADLSSQDSHGVRWEANLAVADRTLRASHAAIGYNYGSTRGVFVRNATWDGRPGAPAVVKHDPGDAGTWTGNLLGVDPQLVDFVPTNAALTEIGWRPTGFEATPLPEPDPAPVPDPAPEPPADPAPEQAPEPVPEPTPETVPNEPAPPADGYSVHSLFAGISPVRRFEGEGPYELGTTFRFATAGKITGLRLYRLAGNGGCTMRVWRAGKVVAKATVEAGGEGWTQVAVNLAVAAGEVLIVSWGKAKGRAYPAVNHFFAGRRGDGAVAASAGLYAERTGALPATAHRSSYYWTDVHFDVGA